MTTKLSSYTAAQVETIKASFVTASNPDAEKDDPSLFESCLLGLMEGFGSSEDHQEVQAGLAKLELTPAAQKLVHMVLVNSLGALNQPESVEA